MKKQEPGYKTRTKLDFPRKTSSKRWDRQVGSGAQEAGNLGACSVHSLTPYIKTACFANYLKANSRLIISHWFGFFFLLFLRMMGDVVSAKLYEPHVDNKDIDDEFKILFQKLSGEVSGLKSKKKTGTFLL